ncbi:hypothetical protein PIB30_079854 [Stylosanthes scabra]|uniref:Uncharacterized protein n=1 Tax=Stylosanthes scabra TaxID=79078 RepID=A0ABU6ZPU3_9FABA|nr:hypothetical protein [Stylosanthes scabra]
MNVASAVLPSCHRHTTVPASPLQPDMNPSAQATCLSASRRQGPVRQFVARLHACRLSLPPCPSSIIRLPSCLLIAGIIASSPSYSARSVVEENSLRSMSRCPSQIVVRVYPNGFPREGSDGVDFHAPYLVVFMMWLVETLSDLQRTVLRNMRLPECTPVIRMAYRFLAMLPDRSCHYKVFWLINDKRVRATFTSHGRILSDQVMDLYVQILHGTHGAGTSNLEPEVQAPMTANPVDVEPPHMHTGETESHGEDPSDSDGGSSGFGDYDFVGNTPVGTRILLPAPLPIVDLLTIDSHLHTLDLDAMEEDRLTDIGGGDDDYNLDGGWSYESDTGFALGASRTTASGGQQSTRCWNPTV